MYVNNLFNSDYAWSNDILTQVFPGCFPSYHTHTHTQKHSPKHSPNTFLSDSWSVLSHIHTWTATLIISWHYLIMNVNTNVWIRWTERYFTLHRQSSIVCSMCGRPYRQCSDLILRKLSEIYMYERTALLFSLLTLQQKYGNGRRSYQVVLF